MRWEHERRLKAHAARRARGRAKAARRRDVARALGVSAKTVRRWGRDGVDAASLRPPGRPPKELDVDTRNEIVRVAGEDGLLGYPTVRARFPDVPSRALKDVLARRCRVRERKARRAATQLEWTIPGTVWAADHATPPDPIDGIFPKLLLVRDLASGMELAVAPLRSETATGTIPVLRALFERHGAPLALKADGGSAFRSDAYEALLAESGVTVLRSPPRRPRYNGSCEASVYWAKRRTADIARYLGRAIEWTSADVERARRSLNSTVADRGPHRGTTAEQRWSSRSPILTAVRNDFRAAVTAAIAEKLERHGASSLSELGCRCRESTRRRAACEALERLEYLKVRGRWSYLQRFERPNGT